MLVAFGFDSKLRHHLSQVPFQPFYIAFYISEDDSDEDDDSAPHIRTYRIPETRTIHGEVLFSRMRR